MKLSVEIPKDILSTLTHSPASSRTSLSSKTPARDLEDRCIPNQTELVASRLSQHKALTVLVLYSKQKDLVLRLIVKLAVFSCSCSLSHHSLNLLRIS